MPDSALEKRKNTLASVSQEAAGSKGKRWPDEQLIANIYKASF